MIGVGMGQHHMRNDGVVAEMFPDVRDECSARVQIAAVDNHQLVRRSIAVAEDDRISGSGSVPDREKLNFAIHLRSQLRAQTGLGSYGRLDVSLHRHGIEARQDDRMDLSNDS